GGLVDVALAVLAGGLEEVGAVLRAADEPAVLHHAAVVGLGREAVGDRQAGRLVGQGALHVAALVIEVQAVLRFGRLGGVERRGGDQHIAGAALTGDLDEGVVLGLADAAGRGRGAGHAGLGEQRRELGLRVGV